MDLWQWLGGADNVTATLLALAAIGIGVWTGLRRTLFKRSVFKRKLDNLAIGVNHEYVWSLLGPPAYGRLDDNGLGSMLWVSAHAYVEVAFETGAAVQVAVTVTDPSLRYDVSALTFGVLQGRLGRHTEMAIEPESRYVSVGARRVWCVLTYWAGGPGGYYFHSLSYNDASPLGRFPDCMLKNAATFYADGRVYADEEQAHSDPELASQIDAQLIPNTIIVSADDGLLCDRQFGVDSDSIRHLRHKVTWAQKVRVWRTRGRL